ncbi:MAG: DUF58 domain-containing protein [Actinomycetota bacterium]
MPTGRGWLLACVGVGLWVAGRAFGSGPLEQLGFGLLGLVILALLSLRRGRHRLEVTRSVHPERVQAGREVKIEVTLSNEGKGPAPLLLLEDGLPPEVSGRARFAVNGIEAGSARKTGYSLRPSRRGHYPIGPLKVTVSDPFGIATRSSTLGEVTPFLVYPRTEMLTLPRDTGRRRTMASSAKRQPTGATGEDFYTLREYVAGDDLRRIHWGATAKRDRYMIRQEETPWHARATILLDDRAGSYRGAGWERAVETAASLADLYHRSGYTYRLSCACASGRPTGRGPDHYHRTLDLLATMDPTSTDGTDDPLLARLLEMEAQTHIEGVLLLVSGEMSPEVAHALAHCGRRFKMVAVLSIPPEMYGGAHAGGRTGRDRTQIEQSRILLGCSGIKNQVLEPGVSLTHAWSALWGTQGASGPSRSGGEDPWDRKQEPA